MSQGTKFALSLVLLMAAMVALFVAFHPNSLSDPTGSGGSWFGSLIQSFQKDLNKNPTSANPPTPGSHP